MLVKLHGSAAEHQQAVLCQRQVSTAAVPAFLPRRLPNPRHPRLAAARVRTLKQLSASAPTEFPTASVGPATMPQQSGFCSVDVIVIGAGPAGLAVAGALKHLHPDVKCVLLEAADTVGSTWHKHYDRLHLHSSKAVSHLPFLQFAEDVPRYPSKKHVANYLAGYAQHFQLDVRLGHRVTAIEPSRAIGPGSGRMDTPASTSGQSYHVTATGPGSQQVQLHAPNVVIATGQNSVPWEPQLPGRSKFKGLVMHSAQYKNPKPFKGMNVLVVGFGNSAGEIALDLSENGAKPTVLIRCNKVIIIPRGSFAPGFSALAAMDYKRTLRPMKPLLEILYGPLCTMGIPNMRPYGVPQVVPWWGGNPGLWDPAPPLIDIGQCAGIVRGDIKVIRGSLEGFTETGTLIAPVSTTGAVRGRDAPEADTELQEEQFDAVILCTGYRECFSKLLPPELLDPILGASRSSPAVSGDTTAVPGLYFIGWDNLLSLLAMIRQEATHLAGVIAARVASGQPIG